MSVSSVATDQESIQITSIFITRIPPAVGNRPAAKITGEEKKEGERGERKRGQWWKEEEEEGRGERRRGSGEGGGGRRRR